jgi:hypothetical protein
MLFGEIIAVNSENHKKPINTLCGQNSELLIVKGDGTFSYHRVLKGKLEFHMHIRYCTVQAYILSTMCSESEQSHRILDCVISEEIFHYEVTPDVSVQRLVLLLRIREVTCSDLGVEIS